MPRPERLLNMKKESRYIKRIMFILKGIIILCLLVGLGYIVTIKRPFGCGVPDCDPNTGMGC